MKRTLLAAVSAFLVAVLSQRLPHAAATATWVNVTGNLANMASECGNLLTVSAMPGTSTIIAGVALKGLWANTSGSAWSHLGAGAGSDTITNRTSWIVYDPTQAGVFWESGIYNGGGVYQTTDGGNTFHQLGTITHIDFVSVDFTDPVRKTLLAGGHEQSQSVFRSTNGGQTWSNVGANLPPNTKFSSDPLIISSQVHVVSLQGWGGGSTGIYRTTNGGTSWQIVDPSGPSGAPLVTSTGVIYWALNGGLMKSTDSGATWHFVGTGLQTVHPIEMRDGRLVSLGANTLMISADGGSTWSPIGPNFPYSPAGVVYSLNRQAFYIWRWDCGNSILPDAIQQLDFASGSIPSAPSTPTNLRIVGN